MGKSSLLRKLINRKKLVRVGSKPGVTQAIHFFLINNQFYFVDLPGYGYAKTSKSEKNKWKYLIETYFKDAVNLRKIILLLDVRRELTENDRLFYEWARSYHFPLLIVITKADKVSRNNAASRRLKIMKELGLSDTECILFSALKGNGKEDILKSIACALDV